MFVSKVVFLLLARGSVVPAVIRDWLAAASLLQMPRRDAREQIPCSWQRLELHLLIFITESDMLNSYSEQCNFFTSQQYTT